MKKERKAEFCGDLQAVLEAMAGDWKRYVSEGKFIEAGGLLEDIDRILTVYSKLKCPE